jgi:BirA family transcriptional regulator, biotin operon repressor / biotin---[acetyl-CoA-carboxylase] ligase
MKLKKFNFKIVNSTNDIAIKLIKNSNKKFGLIVSDKQKKGRGQYGKNWISYNGNLFVSVFFNLDKIDLSIKQITKLNCLIIKKLLSFYYKKKIVIKFPNDIMINKKKICGILQETLQKANSTYMIVGIGINLIKNPNIKNYPTTNLSKVSSIKINKNDVLFKLKKLYEIFLNKNFKFNKRLINNI